MDLKNEIITIDNKNVTNNLSFYRHDTYTYIIKYKNSNKIYTYSENRVKVFDNPVELDLKKYYFYLSDARLENINRVYEFTNNTNSYYRVVFNNNRVIDYSHKELNKTNKNSCDILDYMKKISQVISITTENGKKLLYEELKKIKVNKLNDALKVYFKLSHEIKKENNINCLIFPFGCNSSQYNAVNNAINNKISIIEGPPGTGKTQTILNIAANIIIREMNCQIVSNNNAAIENIDEKLKKYNLDFFEALLGKKENINSFLKNQKENIPDLSMFENINLNDTKHKLNNLSHMVNNIYTYKKEIANLILKKQELSLEYNYFKDFIDNQKIKLEKVNWINKNNLQKIWNELIVINKISIIDKLKYIFIYHIGSFKFYSNDIELIKNTIQNEFYINELNKLETNILEKEKYVKDNEKYENEFINLSMSYFKKYLFSKYKDKRKNYSFCDITKNSNDFVKDYPVILSTTYSSRNTFNNDFKFDYIIMDEASQIDVITGTLALSSAKYAVVIGDEKQLPNVIPFEIKEQTNKIFLEYKLDNGYSYAINSFLDSVKKIITDVPITMLKEHYRCHPKIINFCNKKFYNNELVIMTKDDGNNDVIKVIKTNKGNHSRDKTSLRQVDIIKELIPNLNSKDIGVIAPYNDQVSLIKKELKDIEVSTVHKFQGREKDIIIISTVDDNISDFVANSNILNVAISRAKKKLIFIVTGNEIKNKNINDFIDYVSYNNMEISESKIYSVFDLLYKQYEIERLKFYKKYNKVSKYDSENFIYYLINDILKDYERLNFIFLQPMSSLIKDKSLLNDREKQYASNSQTHIDFLIFNKITKRSVLAIEVDGYKNHKEGTKQAERDKLKNSILEKYNIPLIRLKTNGSGEETLIRNMLDKIEGELYENSSNNR